MARGVVLLALALAGAAGGAACDARLGELRSTTNGDAPGGGGGDGGGGTPADAAPDAIVLGPFGTPTAIPGASGGTTSYDDCTLSSDTLDLIYAVQPNGATNKLLYEMTRASATSAWSAPVKRTELDPAGSSEESPRLSLDDMTLYFGRGGDIYQAKRSTIGGAFGAATAVTAMNTSAYEKWLAVCDGGVAMVSRDSGGGNQDLYEGTLTGGATTAATTLNSTSSEISTFLSVDCLTVYFASNRSGQTQIYYSTRPNLTTDWAAPQLAPAPFSPADGTDNEDPWMSQDQRTFVFSSIRGADTAKSLYISTR